MNLGYLQAANKNVKRKQNHFDRDLSPTLKNSPYLEPPMRIIPPKPLENINQKRKTSNKNIKNRDKYNFSHNHDSFYTNAKYQQISSPKTARIVRPCKKGTKNRCTHLNASSSRFDGFNQNLSEEQKNSPYKENHLKTYHLAQLRANLRIKEQMNEERLERMRINQETTEAIKLETEYETETNDLVFAKNDRRIRIIPSYDRVNRK